LGKFNFTLIEKGEGGECNDRSINAISEVMVLWTFRGTY